MREGEDNLTVRIHFVEPCQGTVLAISTDGVYTLERANKNARPEHRIEVTTEFSPTSEPSVVTATPARVGSMKRQNVQKWQTCARVLVRLSRQILFGVLLCFTIWTASPAFATSPKTTSPAVTQSNTPRLEQGTRLDGATPESFSPGLWIYLLATGVAMLMFCAYLLHRARQRRLLSFEEPEPTLLLDSPPQLMEREPDSLTALVQAVAKEQGTSQTLAISTVEDRPLFAPRGDGHQKECSKCHRKYASWMVVCPFDATPLKDLTPRRKISRPSRRQSALPRKRCPLCERRYEEDAACCPYDKTQLVTDTLEEASSAPSFTICRTCGHDLEDGKELCQCGEDRDPITLHPHDNNQRSPAIPMTICPRCRAYGGFGQTHCATDGALLIPVTSIQANSLPASGYGARRKLCRKCGVRYSGAYVFCSHDGTRLTPIN